MQQFSIKQVLEFVLCVVMCHFVTIFNNKHSKIKQLIDKVGIYIDIC